MSSHYNSTHNELDAIERQVKLQQQQQQKMHHHQQQQASPPAQQYTSSRNKSPNRSSRSNRTVDPRKMNTPRKPPATGSAMARPYRGGFAAAAYETAREDFYFSTASFAEARKQAGLGKRTTPLPTI